MTALATSLVMIAAIMHASWNAIIKSSQDKALATGGLFLIASFLCWPLVFFFPFPSQEVWFYLGISIILHSLYLFFLIQSYKIGDLSRVYPVSRGIAPIFVALGAHFLAGELITTEIFIAISISSFGIFLLAFEKGIPARGDRKPIIFALISGSFIASYTVIDGMGVRASETAYTFILWMFALQGIPFLFWFSFWARHKIPAFRKNIKIISLSSIVTVVAYGFVLYALSLGNMAGISALRETSVVIAAIIGATFLKEGFGKWRIAASAFVAIGVVFLNFF